MIKSLPLFFFCFSFLSLVAQDNLPELKVGEQLPSFQLVLEDSTLIDLNDIESDYVLFFFWHFECSHCQAALSKVEKFIQEEQPKGLTLLSVYPFGYDIDKFWRYVKNPDHKLQRPDFVHATDHLASTRRAFALKGSPPLLLLASKDGKILATNIKAHKMKDIWKSIEK